MSHENSLALPGDHMPKGMWTYPPLATEPSRPVKFLLPPLILALEQTCQQSQYLKDRSRKPKQNMLHLPCGNRSIFLDAGEPPFVEDAGEDAFRAR